MNITKENFNQYVSIAIELAAKNLYREATKISCDAYEIWRQWPEEYFENINEDDLDIQALLKVLTYSQWREMETPGDYSLLVEILNHNNYWSDDCIKENINNLGGWILQEKALAYHMLAKEYAIDQQLYDTYMERAQTYMKQAIETFDKVAKDENDAGAIEFCNTCKINLAMIQRNVSNKLARNTAITLFRESLTEEQKERLMEIYQESTDVLFDEYFEKREIFAIQQCKIEDNSVKDDVLKCLLEMNSKPGNDDPYWWKFTHLNAPEERRMLRFVENIEDAADNDFEEIPWVFTLDRYPFDIEFNEGDEPMTDSVYEIDSENTSKYNRI